MSTPESFYRLMMLIVSKFILGTESGIYVSSSLGEVAVAVIMMVFHKRIGYGVSKVENLKHRVFLSLLSI